MASLAAGVTALVGYLLLAPLAVDAHAVVSGISVNNQDYPGFWPGKAEDTTYAWGIQNQDLSAVKPEDYGSSDIICHRGASSPPSSAIPVSPGDILTLHWTPLDFSHKGPLLTYMARCSDGTCQDLTSLMWQKIAERGIVGSPTGYNGGLWATTEMSAAENTTAVQLPATMEEGVWAVRHEGIAHHFEGNPEHYPNCFKVQVSGGARSAVRRQTQPQGQSATQGTLGTQLYSTNDGMFGFKLYQPGIGVSDYPMPGPALAFPNGARWPDGSVPGDGPYPGTEDRRPGEGGQAEGIAPAKLFWRFGEPDRSFIQQARKLVYTSRGINTNCYFAKPDVK
ncbi:MAG: hypothetical protein M1832_002705 [Thelocarpon impressellum]|nr:MAG: hypothetical protein M1832_002705 [Thelocarpon impressellum]